LGDILVSLNLSWGMDLTPYEGIEVGEDSANPLAEEF